MRGLSFLIFVLVTVASWGIYGPVLHEAQHAMADEAGKIARWKPFMGVGFAYFMIAVIFPIAILLTKGEKGRWTIGGFFWSFFSGAVGAVGALGIILAFNFGGKPVFVMPLVFGCAPVVNTFVTMAMSRTLKEASWIFYVGVLVVAIGAAGVMFLKPSPAKTAHDDQTKTEQVENSDEEAGDENSSSKKSVEDPGLVKKTTNGIFMLWSVALTAVCWGAYGPVLHKGQMKMDGSRLRPFLCVGLAYFVIAVLVPIPMLSNDPGTATFWGSTWSLVAGTAGAIGALGIIYAFNFGGRPIFVMPLVFGLAPVVNTLSTTLAKGLWNEVTWPFLISLGLVILGAVTVLVTAPKAKPAPKKTSKEVESENSNSAGDDSDNNSDAEKVEDTQDENQENETEADKKSTETEDNF